MASDEMAPLDQSSIDSTAFFGAAASPVLFLALKADKPLRDVTEVADKVVFMDGGRVVESGPPSAVLDNPQEGRTRAFLSSLF